MVLLVLRLSGDGTATTSILKTQGFKFLALFLKPFRAYKYPFYACLQDYEKLVILKCCKLLKSIESRSYSKEGERSFVKEGIRILS